MTTHNITQIAKVNSTMEFIANVNNDLMGGFFGNMIVIIIAVMTYMAFVRATNQPIQAFAGAGFVSFTFALLFYMMNMASVWAVWLSLAVTAVSVAFWNMD